MRLAAAAARARATSRCAYTQRSRSAAEATSRVDPETQRAIADATAALVRGRTCLMIAHRLETLEVCDDLAVMEDGDLVEHGRRTELAADPSSRYARLLALGIDDLEVAP